MKKVRRELRKSDEVENRRRLHANAIKRAVETACGACDVLRERLIKTSASRKENEKK